MTAMAKKDTVATADGSLKSVAPASAYELVAERLRQHIITSGLAAGSALEPERTLASNFEVSRHTLREAIRVLEQQGILSSRRGSGTYITLDGINRIAAEMVECVPDERQKLHEIFQLREILEPQVATLAAIMASPNDITHMKHAVAQHESATNAEASKQADCALHVAIAHATQNRLLVEIMTKVVEALSIARSDHDYNLERLRRSVPDHKAVVGAIERGDPTAAQQAMHDHIQSVRAVVLGQS